MEQTKSDSKERKTFKNKSKKKKVSGKKRDSVISFRGSATQRQYIKDLADKCDMSLSGYVLSRVSGYAPKPRLTPEQSSILDQLVLNRSDYIRYASMLNCMSQEQRRSLFRDNAWMRGALECLEKAAGRIMDIINRYDNRQDNRIMVGMAKSISHGKELLQYINGETRDKKHPELIYYVKNNVLDDGLDAFGMWFKMREHARMQKNVIHVIISPAVEHTQHFTTDDWKLLWDDFVKEYDDIEQEADGVVYSHKTNLAGSMATVWLHLESDSGIPHLHAAVCRKDMDGVTNNDHHIEKRAQKAAEAVALKCGWTTAAEIHDSRIEDVSNVCIGILKSMPEWDWNDYVRRLQAKGYKVNARFDKKSVLRGYSIGIGNSGYKASDLGKGRNLMVSKIEQTWQKFHPDAGNTLQQDENKVGTKVTANMQTPKNRIATNDVVPNYTEWHENTTPYELTHDSRQYRLHIPSGVMDVFNSEFDYSETSNWKELTDFAVAIFVGLTALDTVSTGSGGGGGNDEGWRDKKDEDEIERARRCARAATGKIGKTMKTGRRR